MFAKHYPGLFTRPEREWARIAEESASVARVLLGHVVIMALLPAIAWYYGVTEIGWRVAGGTPVKMTPESTGVIVVLFYLAMIAGVVVIGLLIHWMSTTYGAVSSPARAMQLAAYTAAPLFVAGVVGFYPILWLDLLIGVVAACYTVYLLYVGIPPMMGVPRERGYLFASATLAVGLVMFIGLMGATVILWEMGAMPVFTD